MPNIKSAKKRVKVNATKSLRNQMIKNALRTELKKFDLAIADADAENKKAALSHATKCVDQACSKGIMHPNKAARTKSQLAKKVAM